MNTAPLKKDPLAMHDSMSIHSGAGPGTDPSFDKRKVVDILGLPMDLIGYDETVDRVVGWIRGDRRPRNLLTVNSSLLVMKAHDRQFSKACSDVDLAVPDGVPVVWLSKMLGTPLKQRIAGVDLMYSLLERGNVEKLRVYFLGATEEVVQNLVSLCADRFPDLIIAGARNGYFDDASEQAVCEDIRDAGADIVFIGMPSPRKELFAHRYQDLMAVPVVIGVGGSFDVITGKVKRAPVLMQNMGLEWLWRLMMEPRKLWRRYLYTNSRFVWMSLMAVVQRFVSGASSGNKKSGPIL